MVSVVIVGDGPTGMGAALLLAKNGAQVHVVGEDKTPLHQALLRNVLGIEEARGDDYAHLARRQCERFGASFVQARADSVTRKGKSWEVQAGDRVLHGDHLVLATGKDGGLADSLGLTRSDVGVEADLRGRTSLEGVWAGGRLVRGHAVQVAISIGDGAAIALDILAVEKGKPFHDWDTLPKA
jgi:thioredoxin reductase (NADPH)